MDSDKVILFIGPAHFDLRRVEEEADAEDKFKDDPGKEDNIKHGVNEG